MIRSIADRETEKVYNQIFSKKLPHDIQGIALRKEDRTMDKNYIETPTIGEILQEEFMEPMGISAYRLAQDIHVPTSRVQDILHGRRKITADTSLRLAKFFGVSDGYFLDMQNDIDIRNLKNTMRDELAGIKTVQYA